MSIVSPPVAAIRLVNVPLPGDDPDPKNEPPVSEDHNELDEMPQGALVLLAQLQPLREHVSTLASGALRSAPATAISATMAPAPIDQTMDRPVSKPLAPSVPAQGSDRLATPRRRVAAQAHSPLKAPAPASAPVLAQASVSVSARSAVLAPAPASAAVSAPPAALAPAPASAAVSVPSAALAPAPASAAVSVPPTALAPAPASAAVSAPSAVMAPATASVAVSAPAPAPASVPAPVLFQPSGIAVAQASVATAPAGKPDQAKASSVVETEADVSLKQDPTPQTWPAQPLPLIDKFLRAQRAKKPAMPAKDAPIPVLKPEASISKGAANYLQVPFSKGDVAGLITISKAGAERPDQLLLNPSSASIFSHLSDNLAQAPDPRWRLTDQQGREHSHGHHQGRPDEEAEEGSHQAFQDKRQPGRLET